MEISRLIESLGDIKSDQFTIEGGLKLYGVDKNDQPELIGFIVHDNNEWSYSPPVVSNNMQVAVGNGHVQINGQPRLQGGASQGAPPGFAERMGTPNTELGVNLPSSGQRVRRGGQSLVDPRETLDANYQGEAT